MPLVGQPNSDLTERLSGHRCAPQRGERTAVGLGTQTHTPRVTKFTVSHQAESSRAERTTSAGSPVSDGRGEGPSRGQPDSGRWISLLRAGHQDQAGCLHQGCVLDLKTLFSLQTSERGLKRTATRPLVSDGINTTHPSCWFSAGHLTPRPHPLNSFPRTGCQGCELGEAPRRIGNRI